MYIFPLESFGKRKTQLLKTNDKLMHVHVLESFEWFIEPSHYPGVQYD